MKRCSVTSSYELEQNIIDYLTDSPRSSIDEIAEFLNVNRVAVYRCIEGRKNSRSYTGLINAGFVRALPGINYKNNHLVWLYELNNS
jgi:hypothetical protein